MTTRAITRTRIQDRAFTLIELLVVISIIALLIGILLPALGSARATAFVVIDQAQQRSLAQGQALYWTANDEYFAGPNTSGWGDIPGSSDSDNDLYEGDKTPETPTQTFDWISPVIGESLGFSPNRAERFSNIFNDFRDPAVRAFNDILYDGASADDEDDFVRVISQERGFRQSSYISPFAFHAWDTVSSVGAGGGIAGSERASYIQRFGAIPYEWRSAFTQVVWDARTSYRPRIDRVGLQPSEKILVASGSRYLEFRPELSGNQLDFDYSPSPTSFGAFTEGTPQWVGNTAYSDEQQSPSNGAGADLSFRHLGGTMNAAFFDGHSENLSKEQVYERVDWFHPGGMRIGTEGFSGLQVEAQQRFEPGDEIQ